MDLNEASELAQNLIAEHLPYPWKLTWDRAKTRFGQCNHNHKTISLSIPLTRGNSYDEILDTILHEIAHALTPRHGHDSVWSRKALELGSNGRRCSKQPKGIQHTYAGWCKKCGQLVSLKHKRGKAMARGSYYHKACGLKGRIQYLRNDKNMTTEDIGKATRHV